MTPTDETAAGADTVLVWQLPGNPTGNSQAIPVRIVAAVRGPDVAAIVSQVNAVVESIKYDPAVVPLPTDPAALQALSQQALAAALDLGDGASPGSMACFPTQPGSKSATITVAPDGPKLGKPLPVVCSVAIEPNIMQGWTITFTVTWDAASDRKAGRWTSRVGQTFGSDRFPYEVPSGQPG